MAATLGLALAVSGAVLLVDLPEPMPPGGAPRPAVTSARSPPAREVAWHVYDLRIDLDPPRVSFATDAAVPPSLTVAQSGGAPVAVPLAVTDGIHAGPLEALGPAADLLLTFSSQSSRPPVIVQARTPPASSRLRWLAGPRRALPAGIVPGAPSFGGVPLVRSLWSAGLGRLEWVRRAGGLILIDDGRVLAALEAATGRMRWWRPSGPVQARLLSAERLVVAGPGGIVALDVASGRQEWTAPLTDVVALAADDSRLAGVGVDTLPHLYRLSLATGRLEDVKSLPGTPAHVVAAAGRVVLVPPPETGVLLPMCIGLDEHGERSFARPVPPPEGAVAPPVVTGTRLTLAGRGGVVAIDAVTGRVTGRKTTSGRPSWIGPGPGPDEVTVGLAGEEGWIELLRGPALEVARRHRMGSRVGCLDLDSRQALAVGGGPSLVTVLWLRDGRRFPIAMPGQVRQVLVAADGLIGAVVERPGAGIEVHALGIRP